MAVDVFPLLPVIPIRVAFVYFDANSIDSIISAIKELLNDKDPIMKIEQNIEFIKNLKWEETSKKTFNFIEHLANTYV